MADRFRNRYCIKSARLEGYDYSASGGYFVTICTHDREYWFGEIVRGKMQLSEIGEIVADEWVKTEQIRSNVELDEWVIMPNHFHGIIMITKSMKIIPPRL